MVAPALSPPDGPPDGSVSSPPRPPPLAPPILHPPRLCLSLAPVAPRGSSGLASDANDTRK